MLIEALIIMYDKNMNYKYGVIKIKKISRCPIKVTKMK